MVCLLAPNFHSESYLFYFAGLVRQLAQGLSFHWAFIIDSHDNYYFVPDVYFAFNKLD